MKRHAWFLWIVGLLTSLIAPAQTVLFVDADAGGDETGMSWQHAFSTVQAALATAQVDDEIWVAAGVYRPGIDRDSTFDLRTFVTMYGGFAGDETVREQRDWEGNSTVLSGDLGVLGEPGDNAYHVVTGADQAVLDGFIITGGNADGPTLLNSQGGGLLSVDASPTIRHCTFQGNRAALAGGALAATGGNPTIEACRFLENQAYDGAALAVFGDGVLRVEATQFEGNHASNDGGALVIRDRVRATLTGCGLANNEAAAAAGGIYVGAETELTLQDCSLSDNLSQAGGALYAMPGSVVEVHRCRAVANTADFGGAFFLSGAQFTMSGSQLADNWAKVGGGFYIRNGGTLQATRCLFNGNGATVNGGAIDALGVGPRLRECLFASNWADDSGGALYLHAGANASMLDTTFTDNRAATGGAVKASQASPLAAGCLFTGNRAVDGGAMHLWQSDAEIVRSRFSANRATGEGGALLMREGIAVLRHIIFVHNEASHSGGALVVLGGQFAGEHITMAENRATTGGGVFVAEAGRFELSQSILWDNYAVEGAELFADDDETVIHVTNTNLRGGLEGTTSLDASPRFIDVSVGDVRLAADSPCPTWGAATDAATAPMVWVQSVTARERDAVAEISITITGSITDPIVVDYATNPGTAIANQDFEATNGHVTFTPDGPRRQTFRVPLIDDFIDEHRETVHVVLNRPANAELGQAFGVVTIIDDEHRILHVDASATGANDGSSWRHAFTDLQSALAAAYEHDKIWVAKGVYRPTDGLDRWATFQLPAGVSLYGGFEGHERDLTERRPDADMTVLSGDIGVPGSQDDNSYTVVQGAADALLDCFTIAGGSATDEAVDGGGMVIDNCSMDIVDCTFRDNVAERHGGGVLVRRGQPDFLNVRFIANEAATGGALYNKDARPVFTDCTFMDNLAHVDGGAMANQNAEPMLTFTGFLRNQAEARGGAIYNENARPSLECCDFAGNLATDGGAMFSQDSAAAIYEGVFQDNIARESGGALASVGGERMLLYTCTFSSNEAGRGGGAISSERTTMEIAHSVIAGNTATTIGGGLILREVTANLSNTLLVNNESRDGGAIAAEHGARTELMHCTFSRNQATISGGALLASEHAAFNLLNSIVWENDASWGSSIHADPTATVTAVHSCVEGGWPGDGTTSANPFLGATFGLQAGSRAINAGLGGPDQLKRDAKGNPRDDQPDLGAYEFDGIGEAPTLEIADVTVRENEGTVVADVVLTGRSDKTIRVLVNTVDGSGLAGEDYRPLHDVLTWRPGTTGAQRVVLSLIDDDREEPDEYFHVQLNESLYADIIRRRATVTILDNEPRDLYVSASATGDQTGSSWTHAFTDLQDALRIARRGDRIMISMDVYRPTASVDRDATFLVPTDVTLIGGFNPATGKQVPDARTVLSGDIGTFGDPADNVFHVLTTEGKSRLERLSVRSGTANGLPALGKDRGAGLYSILASPEVVDCDFTDHRAIGGGGAVFIEAGSPVFERCRFERNVATRGGALLIDRFAAPRFEACRFIANRATEEGGALVSTHAKPRFNNCVFIQNSAGERGGAMVTRWYSSFRLNFCTLADNRAPEGSGIAALASSGSVLNSILWDADGDALAADPSSYIFTRFSCLSSPTSGHGVVTDNPQLVLSADGARLAPGSPCIGTAGTARGRVLKDADGVTRDARPDMGAFEFVPPPRPSIDAEDVSVYESSGVAEIVVSLNGQPYYRELTLSYTTASSSAMAGRDFEATNGELTWAAGEGGSKTILVPILDDRLVEATETFRLLFSDSTPDTATGEAGTMTASLSVTVFDDDPLSPFAQPVSTSRSMDMHGSVALADGSPIEAGDWLAVQDPDGVTCGLFQLRKAGEFGVMKVYADEPDTPADEGASTGDTLTLHLWRQTTRTLHAASAVEDIPVWAEGRAPQAFQLNAKTELTLPLQAGWNLAGLPTRTVWHQGEAPTDTLASGSTLVQAGRGVEASPIVLALADRLTEMRGMANGAMESLSATATDGGLSFIGGGHANWIQLSEDTVLAADEPALPMDATIALRQGWNLITNWSGICYVDPTVAPNEISCTLPEGTPFVQVGDIGDVLLATGGTISLVRTFDCSGAHTYDPALPEISDLHMIAPGQGLWIRAAEAVLAFSWPTMADVADHSPKSDASREQPTHLKPAVTGPEWLDLFGFINGANAGDEIAVIDQAGNVSGSAIVKAGGLYGFLHLYTSTSSANTAVVDAVLRDAETGELTPLVSQAVWRENAAVQRLDFLPVSGGTGDDYPAVSTYE